MTEKKKPIISIQNKTEKEVLRARAQILAQEPEKVVPASELLEIISFVLGGETYAVESELVREVYPLKDFTPLPGVPPFILGIINVRGTIISIVDLKTFFGFPEKGLGQLNKVVILQDENMEFGLLADEIFGTESVLLKTIQLRLPTITGIGKEFLKGIAPGHLIVLDGKKLLNAREMVVCEETVFKGSK